MMKPGPLYAALAILFFFTGYLGRNLLKDSNSFSGTQAAPPTLSQRQIKSSPHSSSYFTSAKGHQTDQLLRLISRLEQASVDQLPGILAEVGSRQDLITVVIHRWLELDAADAYHYLNKCLEREREGEKFSFYPAFTLSRYLNKWAKQDFAEARKTVGEFDRTNELRVGHYKDLASGLAPLEALLLEKEVNASLIRDINPETRQWISEDPSRAFQIVLESYIWQSQTDPENPFEAQYESDFWTDSISEIWLEQNPREAMSTLLKIEGALGENLQDSFIRNWANNDHQAALKWIEETAPDAPIQHRKSIAQAWARKNPAAALNWIQDNFPEGLVRESTIFDFAEGAIDSDLSEAELMELAEEISSPKTKLDFSALILSTRISHGPGKASEEAIEWLSQIEDPSTRDRILLQSGSQWSWNDPQSFSAFLKDMQDSTIKQAPFTTLVSRWVKDAPLQTIAWASSLNPERVRPTLNAAFRSWISSDADRALSWLAAESLSSEQRSDLLGIVAFQTKANPATTLIHDKLPASDQAEISRHLAE